MRFLPLITLRATSRVKEKDATPVRKVASRTKKDTYKRLHELLLHGFLSRLGCCFGGRFRRGSSALLC